MDVPSGVTCLLNRNLLRKTVIKNYWGYRLSAGKFWYGFLKVKIPECDFDTDLFSGGKKKIKRHNAKPNLPGNNPAGKTFHGFQSPHQNSFPDRNRPLRAVFLTTETADATGIGIKVQIFLSQFKLTETHSRQSFHRTEPEKRFQLHPHFRQRIGETHGANDRRGGLSCRIFQNRYFCIPAGKPDVRMPDHLLCARPADSVSARKGTVSANLRSDHLFQRIPKIRFLPAFLPHMPR